MSNHPTFEELIARFGEIMAWHFLMEIERAAHIKPQGSYSDPEMRLKNALTVQDAMSAPDLRLAA